MEMVWIVLIAIVVVVGGFLASSYNKFVVLKNRVKDQEAQINVQLKRRYDLIPNLIETTKGYANFEKSTLEAVIAARAKATSATSTGDSLAANEEISRSVGRIFALGEAYPALQANQNFMQLQQEFSNTEDKIAKSRQFFNDTVLKYNNAIALFPANIAAGIFGYKELSFLAVAEAEQAAVRVGENTFQF